MSGLWHYTCDHGHERIDGLVVPGGATNVKIAYGPSTFVWFTDLDAPIRDALGLTSLLLNCDRAAHRYRVLDDRDVVPWMSVRRQCAFAEALESAPGAMPRHWFVSTEAVPVVYDPILAVAS